MFEEIIMWPWQAEGLEVCEKRKGYIQKNWMHKCNSQQVFQGTLNFNNNNFNKYFKII